jgi:GNAT superfamily N-acetyltransferase
MPPSQTDITIRPFQPGDAPHFRQLNEEWINRYFVLEPKDVASLSDPQTTILDKGGHIFFALKNEQIVACCALLIMSPGEFEVAKMAVSPTQQGAGVGRRLLEETIAAARSLGATRLYLETNSKLTPAVKLYESVGFHHLPPACITPSPYARANVFMELMLIA